MILAQVEISGTKAVGSLPAPTVEVYLSKMLNLKVSPKLQLCGSDVCDRPVLLWVPLSRQSMNVWLQTGNVKLNKGSKVTRKALIKSIHMLSPDWLMVKKYFRARAHN